MDMAQTTYLVLNGSIVAGRERRVVEVVPQVHEELVTDVLGRCQLGDRLLMSATRVVGRRRRVVGPTYPRLGHGVAHASVVWSV